MVDRHGHCSFYIYHDHKHRDILTEVPIDLILIIELLYNTDSDHELHDDRVDDSQRRHPRSISGLNIQFLSSISRLDCRLWRAFENSKVHVLLILSLLSARRKSGKTE